MRNEGGFIYDYMLEEEKYYSIILQNSRLNFFDIYSVLHVLHKNLNNVNGSYS